MPRPEFHDLSCAVHVHSTYSDGTGTVAQIARAARRASVDIVLLTDHDTLAARDRGEDGYHDGVLVVVGEEVSPEGGNHLLAFGVEEPIDHSDLDSVGICAAVEAAGGIGFAAHPFSRGSERFKRARPMPWRDLDAPGLVGIELWSFVNDSGERITGIRDLLRFVTRPNRWIDLAPGRNLEAWDQMTSTRRVVAIGGIDAHQVGLRVLGRVPLRLMSYRRSFSHLHTHVLCADVPGDDANAARSLVLDALRLGRCYIAMDSLAPARGFAFWAEHGRSNAVTMGGEGPAAPGWELQARVPSVASLLLVKDGQTIVATSGTGLHHHVEEPGVYRLEARLPHAGRERTWILSNPIYLR